MENGCYNSVHVDFIHAVHGACQFGFASTTSPSWKLDLFQFLRAIYYLFHDSPARCGEFTAVTACTVFSLKFCSIRWCENIIVANRALEMLPHLCEWIKAVTNKALVLVNDVESSLKRPSTVSYGVTEESVKNSNILEARIHFFISVSSDLSDFLKRFQSGHPLSPFLYTTL